MIELDHRAEQFLDSIRDEGARSCQEIRQKTEADCAAALDTARREEKRKAARTIRFETARAEVQGNKALSASRSEIRAELARARQALEDEVFAAAEAKLREFTAGGAYGDFLRESAEALRTALGDGAVLYGRQEDLPLLQGSVPDGCTLLRDDAIRLGGLRGEGGNSAADDTLDSRLESQRSWFLEHSGLSIVL